MLWLGLTIGFLIGVFFVPLMRLLWHVVQIALEILEGWY